MTWRHVQDFSLMHIDKLEAYIYKLPYEFTLIEAAADTVTMIDG